MVIPVGYAQVNLKWGGIGLPLGAETTFAVRDEMGNTPRTIAGLVEDCVRESEFTNSLSTAVRIASILVKLGPTETGPRDEITVDIPGLDQPACVPPNTALLVRKATSQGGRKAQGRYFVPGVPEVQLDPTGTISTLYMGDYVRQQADFLEKLEEATLGMWLLHSREESDVLPYAVVSLSPQAKVATQRRRLRG